MDNFFSSRGTADKNDVIDYSSNDDACDNRMRWFGRFQTHPLCHHSFLK